MNTLLYCLARLLIATLQALPLRLVARLSRACGAVAWWLDARHPRVAPVRVEPVDAIAARKVGLSLFREAHGWRRLEGGVEPGGHRPRFTGGPARGRQGIAAAVFRPRLFHEPRSGSVGVALWLPDFSRDLLPHRAGPLARRCRRRNPHARQWRTALNGIDHARSQPRF